jgi:hypothetical protein
LIGTFPIVTRCAGIEGISFEPRFLVLSMARDPKGSRVLFFSRMPRRREHPSEAALSPSIPRLGPGRPDDHPHKHTGPSSCETLHHGGDGDDHPRKRAGPSSWSGSMYRPDHQYKHPGESDFGDTDGPVEPDHNGLSTTTLPPDP